MNEPLPSVDHPVSPDGPRTPELLIFDVNETLSDMSPMADRFEDVGAPSHVARTPGSRPCCEMVSRSP